MAKNVQIFCLLFLIPLFCCDCISIYSMDSKYKQAESCQRKLPICDRAFFGLKAEASDKQYYNAMQNFLQALTVQDRLLKFANEKIVLEEEVKKIEKERDDYYEKFYNDLLKNPRLDNVNRERIENYLKNDISTPYPSFTPIVGTTPLSLAIILRYSSFIREGLLPKRKINVISRLMNSDNKEIQFLGKYFHYNYLIKLKNDRFDRLDLEIDQNTNQLNRMLNQSAIKELHSYFGSGINYVECNRYMARYGEVVQKKGLTLTKEFVRELDKKVRSEQKKIVDSYDKEFFQNLIEVLDLKIYRKKIEELPKSKKTKKDMAKKGKKGALCGTSKFKESLRCKNDCEKNDVDDSEGGRAVDFADTMNVSDINDSQLSLMDNDFIPGFQLHRFSPKRSLDGYHDGSFIENESSYEMAVIDDPCNKMKICLYSCGRQCPVVSKLFRYPIRYTPYVNTWFSNVKSVLAYKKIEDPEERLKAKRIHRFSRHVDRFIDQRGIQQKEESRRKNGQIDLCITMPGHVDFNEDNIPRTCIFTYLIDAQNKACYHRNIEFKDSGNLVREYLTDGQYKVSVPPYQWALRNQSKKR